MGANTRTGIAFHTLSLLSEYDLFTIISQTCKGWTKESFFLNQMINSCSFYRQALGIALKKRIETGYV